MPISRRSFAKNTIATSAALGLSALLKAAGNSSGRKMKIVSVGGHPDDPETGCGGTLAKLTHAGNEVTVIYLTRGEAGVKGKSHAEAAAIRTQESLDSCKILNAKPIFAGQVDGDTIVSNEWVEKIHMLIVNEKPDLVFTHWPLDAHKDHQCAGLLTIQSWIRSKKNFELYFFEVCAGAQTTGFHPTDYVDISATQEQKHKAVYCHTSQNPEGIYHSQHCNHGMMEAFRGLEAGVKAAEGFVRMNSDRSAFI
ncbi:MAG: PIG-L family deacetylase [Chitinophagaceae bacterium]|nr:PIG-L family deacetylase [Chitinophagaceae bacterium]